MCIRQDANNANHESAKNENAKERRLGFRFVISYFAIS